MKRKIRLNRETVRQLTGMQLFAVAAGDATITNWATCRNTLCDGCDGSGPK